MSDLFDGPAPERPGKGPKRSRGARPDNALTPAERQALAAACIPRCKALARTFQGRGLDSGDLLGEALLACVEAARVWVPGGEPGRAWDPSGAGAGTPAAFTSFALAYAKKRLRGLTIERFRAAERVAHHEPDELPAGGSDPGDGPDAEKLLLGPTPRQEDQLAGLSPEAREVVRLVVFDGLDPARAAAQVGRPTKDIRLMLRNAAAKLAALGRPPAGLFDAA